MESERLTEAFHDLYVALYVMRVTFDWAAFKIGKFAELADTVDWGDDEGGSDDN